MLNVIQVAAFYNKTVSALSFLNVVKDAMTTQGPETGKKENDQVSREIGGTIQYIADKIADLMLKSQMSDSIKENLQLSHFEELRTSAISKLEKMKADEENKDIIIDSLEYLKGKL